jgi:hypothetical protein
LGTVRQQNSLVLVPMPNTIANNAGTAAPSSVTATSLYNDVNDDGLAGVGDT